MKKGPGDHMAFLPDSRTLVTGGWDGAIKLWDIEELILEQTPLSKDSGRINAFAFSPDGKRLVAAVSGNSGKSVLLWDAETGRGLGLPELSYDHSVRAVAFSPDGKLLVTGAEQLTIGREGDRPNRM